MDEPGNVLSSLDGWLRVARQSIDKSLAELQTSSQRGAERVQEHLDARRALFAEHKDAATVQPFPVPLTILLTMWDEIEKVEGENRKWLLAALRFMAHTHGASIFAVSTKNDASLSLMRSTFSAAFLAKKQDPKKEVKKVGAHEPLFVKAGDDSLDEIGTAKGQAASVEAFEAVVRDIFPPGADDSDDPLRAGDRVLVRNRIESEHDWKIATVTDFERGKPRVMVDGQERPSTWDLVVKDDEAAKFAEPLVDAMVEQRREELAKYRAQADRAQRMASTGLKSMATANA
jgi:hypothetical protein